MFRPNPDDFQRAAENMDAEDLHEAMQQQAKAERIARNAAALRRFCEELCDMGALLRDFVTGRYTNVPFRTAAAIAFALLYVVCPVDAIPDIIPVIGYMDDAGVVAACLMLIADDLKAYHSWRMEGVPS
jgi:uncharacterized membrane protein YkvA (DUF1232 family)